LSDRTSSMVPTLSDRSGTCNRYGPWLHAELERRAAYACLDDVADFRSAVRAVTRAGQIKDTDRHEKLARSSSNEFSDRFDT
jgi:uncharacterized protein YPO0396